MSLKILLDCKKAIAVCHKCQYDESAPLERLILHLHNCYCPECRAHSKKNKRLTQLIKEADIKVLSPKNKNILRKLIEQELANSK